MATTAQESLNQTATTERPAPSGPPARPARSRRRFVLPILAVLVLVAAVWAIKKWSYSRSHESTDNAQVDGHIVPVLAKVGGYVTSVTVSDNQQVREAALLVSIDSAEYAVRLAQAEADLAAAQAATGGGGQLGQAQAAVQTAASQRAASDAQIAAARANLDKARSDLARTEQLAAKEIVSQQQLDAERANVQALEAQLEATQRQAAAAGSTVGNARAGIRLAEARLQAAQASRQNAALQLSYTRVTAPVTGVVSRKQVEVGQLVQPGQTADEHRRRHRVWVTANYKETQLADIRAGRPVEFDVDGYPGCTARGVVESVSPATGARFALLPPDNATGNFTKVVQRIPVRVKITEGCGPNRPLRRG
jgi:membrane fusion protein (multidrug efflux system)